jgi:hypothetical protein
MRLEVEVKSTVVFQGKSYKVLCIMNGWATIFPASIETDDIREVVEFSSAVRVKNLQKAAIQ